MLHGGMEPAEVGEEQPWANPVDPGPAWIVFCVLTGLGLLDSIYMVATHTMGSAIGFGWTKEIAATYLGLARAASGRSVTVLWVASAVAQLGVIALFVLFTYLARRRSVRGYLVGLVVYAAGMLPAVSNQDFGTAGVHLLGLVGLIGGLVTLRRNVSTTRLHSSQARPQMRPTWIAAGCGGLAVTTLVLTASAFLFGTAMVDSRTFYADCEQKILALAPADFNAAERAQLHQAMVELAELERRGVVNMAIDSDLRWALTRVVVPDTGGPFKREDVHRLYELVEAARRRAAASRAEVPTTH